MATNAAAWGRRPRTTNSPLNQSDEYRNIHQARSLRGVMPILAIASILLGIWLLLLYMGGRDARQSWQTPIAYHAVLTVVKVIAESTFRWNS